MPKPIWRRFFQTRSGEATMTDLQSFVLVRRICLVCSLLIIFNGIGCMDSGKGPNRIAVRGLVTLDGEPLESGVIRFIPAGETKGPAAVLPIVDGNYKSSSVDGPVEGTYRVEIDKNDDEELAQQALNPKEFVRQLQQNGKPFRERPLPQNYNRQSILTADIAADGDRTFDWELENVESNTKR